MSETIRDITKAKNKIQIQYFTFSHFFENLNKINAMTIPVTPFHFQWQLLLFVWTKCVIYGGCNLWASSALSLFALYIKVVLYEFMILYGVQQFNISKIENLFLLTFILRLLEVFQGKIVVVWKLDWFRPSLWTIKVFKCTSHLEWPSIK